MKVLLFLFLLSTLTLLQAEQRDEAHDLNTLLHYKESGQYLKAIGLATEIISYTQNTPFSEEREGSLVALYVQVSELYLMLHQKEKALEWLAKVAQTESRYVPKPYKEKLVQMFCVLGQRDLSRGNSTRALTFIEQSYRFSLELYGEKSPRSVNCALELGNLYYKKGRYKEAFTVTKSAYDIIETRYKKENMERLTVASNLGTYLMSAGEYERALPYELFALKHMKKKSLKTSKTLASLHNTLALTYINMAQYPEAEGHLKSALNIKNRYKQSDVSLIKIYNHFALLSQHLGNDDEALNYYKKALALIDKLNLRDKAVKRAIYANVAQLHMGLGQSQEAVVYFEKALKISEKEQIERAYVLSNLGLLYTEKGALKKADAALTESLRLKKKYLGADHLSLVSTYLNRAALYKEKKESTSALKMEKEALKILERSKVQNDLLQRTYYALAETYAMQGKRFKSYEAISKSVAYFLQLKVTAYSMTSQKEKAYFKEAYQDLIEDYFAVTYAYVAGMDEALKQKTIQDVLANWIKLKHSIFDVSEQFRVLAFKTKDAKVKARVEKLLASERQLAKLYQERTIDSSMQERKTVKINLLLKEIARNEKYLSKKVKDANLSGYEESIDIANLSKHLAEQSLYLDFVKTSSQYYLFSVDSQNHYGFYKFDENITDIIENKIREIHVEISKISSKEHFADLDMAYKQYGTLFSVLNKTINFSQQKSLVISADGLLHLLPFEALYDSQKKQFLLEQMSIRYVSSAKDLFIASLSADREEKEVTVFANPAFDANMSTGKELMRGMFPEVLPKRFDALPGTEREAADIQTLFPASHLFVGADATEEALFQLHSPHILHIATHGFFLKENTMLTPLMKTGIVLSAANSAVAKKEGEGIVTGLELAGLDLQKTDLVVLSSCYSGIGDIENGEGMMTLADAFKKAGAKNVLSSLWAVNDMLGEKMMLRFYESLKKGKMYENALRKAKLHMMEEGVTHPYYWAGFILYSKGNE